MRFLTDYQSSRVPGAACRHLVASCDVLSKQFLPYVFTKPNFGEAVTSPMLVKLAFCF